LEDASQISDNHRAAMEGWKARKDQLHRQQESVWKANDEAEGVDLISLSKKKAGKGV
jgi:nicotinate-nucleotide pyrophosphorylase